MEYRLWKRTGRMVSAICLGGHWKRINEVVPGAYTKSWLSVKVKENKDFLKNRRDVVTRCMELGINHIDACTWQECYSYSQALKGRRDKMYLGFSWYQEELRNKKYRTEAALLGTLDKAMKECGEEYVDFWRITMHEKSSRHPEGEVEEMMKALEKAKKQGKARAIGFSSHDRPHIKGMLEKYPEIVDGFCTPYTAKTKELPTDSVFEVAKKQGVAIFGIKPFASGSVFKGRGSPKGPEPEEDNKRARVTLRFILQNPQIHPIPGLISVGQVENAVKAVQERRELDKAELEYLDKVMDETWANLPPDYQWLKDWEWV
jgi:predicted aldo/keto reductase-like oxidoreductase